MAIVNFIEKEAIKTIMFGVVGGGGMMTKFNVD